MLEKIGLPAKPSLRGNNWVVDASHCQGCSSQFTFINRKHHCRRCGGIFCGSCTQQRMLLRGQGDSPVRICEPCKKLEEAARAERYGHKSRATRGNARLTSKPEGEILNQILGNDGKELGQEVVSSIQRESSSASCSNSREDFGHDGVGEILRSVSVDESDRESGSPEELRQQALEEKKKHKILKGEGKSAEALRAFKKAKELERQADALEISLRKKRKKDLVSDSVAESQTKDDIVQSGRRSRVTPSVGRDKDDISAELKELGWSDMDLREEDKKQASLTVEGELFSLLGEVSQKTNKGSSGIDKTQVFAHKKKALQLKREGKLAEAKEELKRAKILEKQLEEQELLGEAEESDDEISALIRSMDDDKEDISLDYEPEKGFNFDTLMNTADDHTIDDNFEVTDEDMMDPEITAALQSFGWTPDTNNPTETSDTQTASVDREAILTEIQSLKREALTHKRAGNVTEAMAQLKKAKLLERDLEGMESQEENVVKPPAKPAGKSKSMIQKELLGLKKKALALRREGRIEEAEDELKKGRVLEHQLEEMENGSMIQRTPVVVGSKGSVAEEEVENVTDQDMYDPAYLSMLKNLGWNDDDNEDRNSTEEPNKQVDSVRTSQPSLAVAPGNVQVVVSRRIKAEIQSEILGLKRKAFALRRQGETDEAEEMLRKAKALESQLVEVEAPKKDAQSDFGKHRVMFTEPPLNIAEEEDDAVDVTENDMQDPALLSVLKNLGWEDEEHSVDPSSLQSSSKAAVATPRSKSEIQRELLVLKRKAYAFRRNGQIEEAEEVLNMAKGLEVQIEELEAPKTVHENYGLLMNTEKQGSMKDDKNVVNQRIDQGAVQSSPAQSGNFSDLLTGDDWSGSTGSAEKQYDSRTSPITVGPPIQSKSSHEDPRRKDDAIVDKRENTVVANEKLDVKDASLVLGSSSHDNESSVRQEIKTFKLRALAFKREGKLVEAREELRQAKVLEKHFEEDSPPQSKTVSSDASGSAQNISPVGQKHQGSPPSDPKPMSSRDRFKLQQQSLGHKRQALKLRREGRIEEAEAEFELAKALEAQLEESTARDSSTVAPVDDVAIEGLLDPELMSALRAIGIEDANTSSSQGPGRPEPSKLNVAKTDDSIQERSALEEQIKAEKVKALHLKRAGKQAEALDALRRSKMLEKKLNSAALK